MLKFSQSHGFYVYVGNMKNPVPCWVWVDGFKISSGGSHDWSRKISPKNKYTGNFDVFFFASFYKHTRVTLTAGNTFATSWLRVAQRLTKKRLNPKRYRSLCVVG